MKKAIFYALFVVALLLGSCASTGGRLSDPDLECICGTAESELYGCHNVACLEDVGNPDNPLCACGPLYTEGVRLTLVSAAGGKVHAGLGQMQYLFLKSGGQVRGILIADDGASIELRTQSKGTRTYTYDQLDPRSVYRLVKAKTPKDDGPGRLELANYARDHGFYAHARRHYKEAQKADSSLAPRIEEDLARLRRNASQDLLAEGREKLDRGDVSGAEKDLTALINEFPLEPAAEQAAALLTEVDARQQEEYARSGVKGRSEKITKTLGPAHKDYEQMVERNRDGLLSSRSQSRAIKHFEAALKEGKRAMRKIEGVRTKNGGDPQYAAACDELQNLVVDQIVHTSINLASVYLTRESYQTALGAVNTAIAYDPDNAEARALRARVETAASDDGWGWGGGRIHGR